MRRIQWDIIIDVHRSSDNFPLSLSDFNETCYFGQIFKKTQISNFMKICPEQANFFHADGWTDGQTNGWTDKLKDGQTDMRNLTVALLNFGNRLNESPQPLKATMSFSRNSVNLRPQKAFKMDIPSYFNGTTDDYGTTCLFQGWIPFTGFLFTLYRSGPFVLQTWYWTAGHDVA
jgi:hypothetical protein